MLVHQRVHCTTSHTPPLKKVRLNVPWSNWLYKIKLKTCNNPLPCTYHSANHLRLRFGWRTRRPQKHLTIALQACQHQRILWNKNIQKMSVLWGILFSNRNCKQIAGSYQYVCVLPVPLDKTALLSKLSFLYQLASFFLSNSVPFSPNSVRQSTSTLGSASCFFNKQHLISQWPFQEPKIIGGTNPIYVWPIYIYQALFFQGISPQFIWPPWQFSTSETQCHHPSRHLPGICSTSAPWADNLAFFSRSSPPRRVRLVSQNMGLVELSHVGEVGN